MHLPSGLYITKNYLSNVKLEESNLILNVLVIVYLIKQSFCKCVELVLTSFNI